LGTKCGKLSTIRLFDGLDVLYNVAAAGRLAECQSVEGGSMLVAGQGVSTLAGPHARELAPFWSWNKHS